MRRFVLCLGLGVAASVQPVLADTYLQVCQRGNATLHYAEINGFNGLFAKTKGAEGWYRLDGGRCYREALANYQTKEYVYAAQASDGTIVPIALDMGLSSKTHRLKREQLCVPQAISGYGRHRFRDGAEFGPCLGSETSFPATFMIEGGSADEQFEVNLNVDQDEVDRIAAPQSQAAPATKSDNWLLRALIESQTKAPPEPKQPARRAEDLARDLPRNVTASGTGDVAD